MRARYLILIVLLAGQLTGCAWLRDRWPWKKKAVPITPPSEVDPVTDPTTQPETQPAARSQPVVQPLEPLDPSTLPEEQANVSTEPLPLEDSPLQAKTELLPPAADEASPASEAEPLPLESPAPEPDTLENPAPNSPTLPPVPPLASNLKPLRPEQPIPLENLALPDAEIPTHPAEQPFSDPAEEPVISITLEPKLDLQTSAREPALPAPPATEQPTVPSKPLTPLPDEPTVLPETAPAVAPPPIEYGRRELVTASLLQINDRFLTVEDILQACTHRLEELNPSIAQESFRKQTQRILENELRRQVSESLAYAEADRRLTDEQKDRVEEEVQTVLRRMIAEAGGSRERLEAMLAQEGRDLQTDLEKQRRQMMIQGYMQARFEPAIATSRRMLWETYRENLSQFTAHKAVQMQIIAAPIETFLPEGTARPSETERQAAATRAKTTIEQAAEALQSGEDFGDVARRVSRGLMAGKGGVWPMMEAGNFREVAVETAAFQLKEGQISEILQTESGYFLVKAKKVQPGKIIPFEEAQVQIEQELRNTQLIQLQEEYFQRLFKGAQIHHSEPFLQHAVDRAVELYWQK